MAIKNSLNTNWDGKQRQTWTFYCPLCAAPRKLVGTPNPGKPMHYIQVGLCSLMFALATHRWFEWKGLVSFLPMWIVFEVVYRTRVRARLACSDCGFDPVLCMTDSERAKREVEAHWKKLF